MSAVPALGINPTPIGVRLEYIPVGVLATATLRDAKNQVSVAKWYATGVGVAFLAAANALAVAIDTASNCHLDNSTGNPPLAPVAGGTSGNWIDVEDKGVVVIQTASGALHRFEVPAPVDGFFLPDGETMDGAGVGQDYGDVIIANAVTKDGVAFVSVVGGYRDRVRTQRKFNIRTRTPQLTGQGL